MNTVTDIVEEVYRRVCGTCDDIMTFIDYMIEDGEIDQAYFRENELDILSRLDGLVFNCAVCGWNYEISEMSMNESNMTDCVCIQCGGDDES